LTSCFIDFSLSWRRSPRADDAISFAAFDVNYEKDALSKRGSDDNHATYSRPIIEVHSKRIGEDGGCFSERDAMLDYV